MTILEERYLSFMIELLAENHTLESMQRDFWFRSDTRRSLTHTSLTQAQIEHVVDTAATIDDLEAARDRLFKGDDLGEVLAELDAKGIPFHESVIKRLDEMKPPK